MDTVSSSVKNAFARVSDIPTPALLIDLDILERNMSTVAKYFSGVHAHLRAHVKNHKIPIIAHKQIEAGSRGICCAKLGEAEVMAASGIHDILITTQVVDLPKVARLVSLRKHSDVKVVVDSAQNVEHLALAAQAKGVELGVLVEVDVGMHRAGTRPGEPTLELVKEVEQAKGLRFMGLQGYEGHASFIKDYDERERKAEQAIKLLTDTKQLVQDAGIEVPCLSAGGSGTYNMTGENPEIDEIQAGSYVTMSTRYDHVSSDFGYAVTVLTQVISRPTKEKAITDSGCKAISFAYGMPLVKDMEGATVEKLSVEHGWLELSGPSVRLRERDKIELIPSFEHTTINVYDRAYAVRDGLVEAIWSVAARGRSD